MLEKQLTIRLPPDTFTKMIDPAHQKKKNAEKHPCWRVYSNILIAREFSRLTRYCCRVIQWLPVEDESGLLLKSLEAREKLIIRDDEPFPDLSSERDCSTAVLLNGTFNYHYDIQSLLLRVKPRLSRTSRLLVVAYNPYLAWLYRLANLLGFRDGELPSSFLTRHDMENIVKLSGYGIVGGRNAAYFPFRLFGAGDIVNRIIPLIPGFRWLGLAYCMVLRPEIPELEHPSLSCVIPARNERGNIANAIKGIPDLGCRLEILFVEGGSNDGTWEEILRLKKEYEGRLDIKALRQNGRGKSDAVRLGLEHADGDLLTILDADLTMPPELLGRFYSAYCQGLADFVNGSRLVYPMERNAMRFLNRLGNVFFAKTLSWVLGVKIGDSLCGTKFFSRGDYKRMVDWRKDFGDFDPFGDFELLFPAATLGLGIVDIPVRYRERIYGTTNILRFRHGLMLFRMVMTGFWRIKLGVGSGTSR